MIFYSPELDQFMVVLISINQIDFDVTNFKYNFVKDEPHGEEIIKSHAWYYIGEL